MIFFVLLPQITYVIAQMGKDTRIMGCRCVLFLEYSSQIIWTLFTQNLGANFFILFVLKNCTFGFANYKSYAQVAKELKISINTVDVQLQKAVTRLRDMLSRYLKPDKNGS